MPQKEDPPFLRCLLRKSTGEKQVDKAKTLDLGSAHISVASWKAKRITVFSFWMRNTSL
jgi:hypothetical protein